MPSPADNTNCVGRTACCSIGGLMRHQLPNGEYAWGKIGSRPGWDNGIFAWIGLAVRPSQHAEPVPEPADAAQGNPVTPAFGRMMSRPRGARIL
ncbi:hypothetical protein [Streptomyces sp. NRRL S-813]|uniref:hypothetical protein n=1 Tax=Streptomyces sp. NRRL S-813 TaxID=1463919 RepID=UPI000A4DE8A4|nr:hypothetical protein [Streptomyces sp. NRRL S-813]